MIFNINKNIEIIFFLEKENYNLRKFLEKKEINKIFIDNENTIDEIIEKILEKNNFNLEIEKLKKILEEKNENKINIENNYKKNNVIAITGNYGSGKSLITAMFGKLSKINNIKTIIIDFDIINNSINTLFRINRQNLYENYITHINNYLDIFCGLDLLFSEENKINFEKVENMINELKEKYDLVLIDTSSETNLKYIKIILANVDKIIFLIEPNLLEIKKAEQLIEIYVEDWEIPKEKIDILLNKIPIFFGDTSHSSR